MAQVKFSQPTDTPTHSYQPDVVYEVDDARAEYLVQAFGAEIVERITGPSQPQTATAKRGHKATKRS